MRYYYIPSGIIGMEELVNPKCWEYMEHLELSFIAGRNVNCYNHTGKPISPSTKGKHVHTQ